MHPRIPMRRHSVVLDGQTDEVMRRIRTHFEAGNVLVREDDRIVDRFGGTEGGLAFHTVELITFAGQEVTFEHLGGTFYGCWERFWVQPAGQAKTELAHEGWFAMRGGLVGWLLGIAIVRRLFVKNVEQAMRGFEPGSP